MCSELRQASRHIPGGQRGNTGGSAQSEGQCAVWVAALAPTVVDTRDAAPRWPVTGHFPGLRRSRIHDPVHTAWQRRRWRWCVQRAISVRAAALTQHGTRCWASVAHTRTRWWFLAERAYSRIAQVAKRGGETRTDRARSPQPPPGRCRARPRLSNQHSDLDSSMCSWVVPVGS